MIYTAKNARSTMYTPSDLSEDMKLILPEIYKLSLSKNKIRYYSFQRTYTVDNHRYYFELLVSELDKLGYIVICSNELNVYNFRVSW